MIAFLLEDDKWRVKAFESRFKEIGWDYHTTDNFETAKKYLNENKYDIIFLDHDLGGWEGILVAKHVADVGVSCPVVIHSLNPVGARNMHNILPGSVISPRCWERYIFHNSFGEE